MPPGSRAESEELNMKQIKVESVSYTHLAGKSPADRRPEREAACSKECRDQDGAHTKGERGRCGGAFHRDHEGTGDPAGGTHE